MQENHVWKSVSSVLLMLAVSGGAASAQNAFTYQGRLEAAGIPANGSYAFVARLFDNLDQQHGPTLCEDVVPAVNGLFTLELDFGPQFAAGERLLDIQVLEDGDCADQTGFVQLSPRQLITTTPFASHALVAEQAESAGQAERAVVANAAFRLDAPDGSPTNAVFVDNAGKVGIGTTAPTTKLHVNGDVGWGGTSTDLASSGQDGFGVYLEQRGSSSAKSKIRLQTSKSGDLGNYSQFFIDPNAGFAFTTLGTGNGNVGIGTTAPAAKLDVRGDIKLGTSGEYFAPAGGENLRFVRGLIRGTDGAVLQGSGFTAARTGVGRYTITFSTPFASPATITTTSDANSCFGCIMQTVGVSSSAANLHVTIPNGSVADTTFHFIAVGPR